MRHLRDYKTRSTEMVIGATLEQSSGMTKLRLNGSRLEEIGEVCTRQSRDHRLRRNEDDSQWRWRCEGWHVEELRAHVHLRDEELDTRWLRCEVMRKIIFCCELWELSHIYTWSKVRTKLCKLGLRIGCSQVHSQLVIDNNLLMEKENPKFQRIMVCGLISLLAWNLVNWWKSWLTSQLRPRRHEWNILFRWPIKWVVD